MRLHLALFVAIALAPAAARAQDFVGARALGLGEAYRAIATGNDGIYFNPAGLPQLKRFSVEGHYFMNLVEETHQADVSVVDSKTNPLAVGIAYTFQGSELTKRRTLEHTATLGAAYPVFDRYLSIGAGFKYKNVSDAFAGNYLNAVTADAGILSQLGDTGISIGAVGYNLIPIRSVDSAHVPVSAGFGIAWDLGPASALVFGGDMTMGAVQTIAGVPQTPVLGTLQGPLRGLTIAYDWFVDFENLYGWQSKHSVGIEYLFADLIPVRAGYMYDEVDPVTPTTESTAVDPQHRVSAGIGLIVPYFGLDVTYRQSITELDARELAIALKGFLPL